MRCFIAIDIDSENKKAIADLQQQLQSKVDIKKSDAKWVNPDNIHLTLKFLGEVKDEKTVEICNIVENVTSRHQSFEFDIETLGSFGGKSPRVLWVGTGAGADKLLQLQEDIEKNLALAGWPEETRQFSGHLTLCRIKNPKAGAKLARVAEQYADCKLGTILADAVNIYQSQLTPTGPVYTLLASYKLH